MLDLRTRYSQSRAEALEQIGVKHAGRLLVEPGQQQAAVGHRLSLRGGIEIGQPQSLDGPARSSALRTIAARPMKNMPTQRMRPMTGQITRDQRMLEQPGVDGGVEAGGGQPTPEQGIAGERPA